MRRRALELLPIFGLVLAACGSGANEVNVTTSDSGMSGSMTSDVTTFTAGETYHFVVTNEGSVDHEVMIMPPAAPGSMDKEDMEATALYIVDRDQLAPGETVEFDFTFPDDSAGTDLEFACHIEGHYQAGMHMPITVES